MKRIEEMIDCEGKILKSGDFVQLVIGKEPYINKAMKKGFVFKISYMEDRRIKKDTPYPIAFLTDKRNSGRIYSSGCLPYELKKVNYDIKKRKVIGD